jgi:hypothetical protein
MAPNDPQPNASPVQSPLGWVDLLRNCVAILGIALLLVEGLWRVLGYSPQKSDYMFFAKLRKNADLERNAVVLVGSSRIRFGLSPEILGGAVPGRHFLQLALDGSSPLPMLYDLAEDDGFRGLVVCEVNPLHWDGQYQNMIQPGALTYFHRELIGRDVEMVLSESVREHFSFYSYNLLAELPKLLERKPPPRGERSDRFEPFSDLGHTLDEKLIQDWETTAKDAAKRIGDYGSRQMPQTVQGWVQRIRERGGNVAFVRMPTDGRLRVLEDRLFPYLPSLIRDIRAHGNSVIDFADMPENFYCPDGSRLEASSAQRFSARLGEELTAKGFFR